MKQRFTLYRRGRVYYCQDTITSKQKNCHRWAVEEAILNGQPRWNSKTRDITKLVLCPGQPRKPASGDW